MPRPISRPETKFAKATKNVKLPVLRRLLWLAETDPRSFAEVCKAAGYNEGALHVIRSGRNLPKIDKVVYLGAALGYELIWRKKK